MENCPRRPEPSAHLDVDLGNVEDIDHDGIGPLAADDLYFDFPPFLPNSLCAADDLRGLDLPSFAAFAFAFRAVSLPLPFFSVMNLAFTLAGEKRGRCEEFRLQNA